MTFSIRNLLAVVLVAALGIFAFRTYQDAQREQERLTKVLAEIELVEREVTRAEARLHMDNPTLHQAIRDEYEAIQKLRKRCEANIELLREKYGSIEPRGPRVLSIKNLPSIRGETGETPVALRVYVPEEREVWLKYGVHDDMSKTTSSPDFESGLLRQSTIGHVGPYEKLLPPGHHVLSMTIGDAESGSLPLRIKLDSSVLIDTGLRSARKTGGGWIASRPEMQQMDFPDGKLHWGALISAVMTLSGDEGNNSSKELQVLVWMGNEASGFSEFPGSK